MAFTWSLKNTGLHYAAPSWVSDCIRFQGRIYAIGHYGIAYTTNYGDNWTVVVNGYAAGTKCKSAGIHDGILYVSAYSSGGRTAVYYSANGDDWTHKEVTTSTAYQTGQCVYSDDDRVYIGCQGNLAYGNGTRYFWSDDDGDTWNYVTSPVMRYVNAFAWYDGKFYICGMYNNSNKRDYVAYCTNPISPSWTAANTGLSTTNIQDVNDIVEFNGDLYCCDSLGYVYKLITATSWTVVNSDLITATRLYSANGRLYVSGESTLLADPSVYSTDDGTNWDAEGVTSYDVNTHCCFLDTVDNHIWVGTDNSRVWLGSPPPPDPPTGTDTIPGIKKNTVSWDDSTADLTYNLYYKKDKSPNCYFYGNSGWTVEINDVGETATFSSNKVTLDIPNSVDGFVDLEYSYPISSGDFEAIVDVANYTPDSLTTGFYVQFIVSSGSVADTNYAGVYFRNLNATPQYSVRGKYQIDGGGVTYTDSDTINNVPTKLKVERSSNDLNMYYYDSGWVLLGTADFGADSSELTTIHIYISDNTTTGGSVDYSNLVVTPSAMDDYDGVINDIDNSTYSHESLDSDSVYCYELTAEDVSEQESDPSEETFGVPEALGIPHDPYVIPTHSQNVISFEHGYPNDYFGSLENKWLIETKNGTETATIVSDKLRIDIPDGIDGHIRAKSLRSPLQDDFEMIIDVSNYTPDDVDDGHQVSLRLREYGSPNVDMASIYFAQINSTTYRVRGMYRVNSVLNYTDIDDNPTIPTKLKLVRSGTTIEFWYYDSGWIKSGEVDFGDRVYNLTEVVIFVTDILESGGSVDLDNLCIVPISNYFLNDNFSNLDRWDQSTTYGTISLIGGAVRLDVTDGQDGAAVIRHKYSIPPGDFILDIDLVDYFADAEGTDNALDCWMWVADNNFDNRFYIYYNHKANYVSHVAYKYNGGSITHDSDQNIGSEPSKLRIKRAGTILYGYVYTDSWVLIGQYDFDVYASSLYVPSLYALDKNNRGGYVDFDNLTYNFGANSYNLYWKKDKCPNCYFDSLEERWIITKLDGSEVCEIDIGKLSIDIPDATDASVIMVYTPTLPAGDFEASIDFSDYLYDHINGPRIYFCIISDDNEDNVNLWYRSMDNSPPHQVRVGWKDNGVVTYSTSENPANIPTKLRIRRVGTVLYVDYYLSGWVNHDSYDFGARSSNLTKIKFVFPDESLHGGSFKIDNLIITPSVKDDYDGVVNDIIDLSYTHTDLDGGSIYCYEITADGSESEESEEIYGAPTALNPPIIPSILPAQSQNTISWIRGPQNEYFSNDLRYWTFTKTLGSETGTIVSGRLRLDIPSSDTARIDADYTFPVPEGDFEIIFSMSNYTPDVSADGPFLYFRITDSQDLGIYYKDWAGFRYHTYNVGGSSEIDSYLCLDEDSQNNELVHPTGTPTKFKISRNNDIISICYYLDEWIILDYRDYGSRVDNLKYLEFILLEDNNKGGSVDVDNLVIISDKPYFPNDSFNNLDNWIVTDNGNASASINDGKLLLDIVDGYDTYVGVVSKYSISKGDAEISIDLSDYSQDHSDGFHTSFYFDSQSYYSNGFRIWIEDDHVRIKYCLDGAGEVSGDIKSVGFPDKVKIARVGSIIRAYYDIGSGWVQFDSVDFGSSASELFKCRIIAYDINSHGGSLKIDNFAYDNGTNSYNLYWKKDKCPNCYFYNTDDWTVYKKIGTETFEIISNKARLTIPDSSDSNIQGIYSYLFPGTDSTNDAAIVVDIDNYDPENSSWGNQVGLTIEDLSGDNYIEFYYDIYDSTKRCYARYQINDGGQLISSVGNPSETPTKLKLEFNLTNVYLYYYESGWVLVDTLNFGEYISLLTNIGIKNNKQTGPYGGSVDFDNLIITPSVVDDYDGVVNDIIDLNYKHDSLDSGTIYCYEITADGSESLPSEEIYEATPPDTPTNFSVVPGLLKNTLSWDSVVDATTYNVYWAIDYYPNEYFGDDLSNWTIYRDQGGEYVEIVSNKLKTELYDSVSTGWDILHNTALPMDEFIVEVDLVTYTPSDNSNGHYIYFYVNDSYGGGTDYAYIRYHVSGGGSTHNIRTNLVLNGSDNIFDTTISGTPTKFRIKRDGNFVEIYYYISSWVLVDSLDFGARASLLDYVQIGGIPNGGNGGVTEFDNILYWPDLKENGTKISDVTSPYDHTSLTEWENYYYVVVSENEYSESDASIQEIGIPVGLPDPPTGISVVEGSGQNTITFTVDPEATITNIYWDTSPGVTTEDNKIADVTSPHIHDDLNPSLTYYYVLTSENGYGEGPPSSEHSSSPFPEPPTGVGASAGIEKNSIYWTDSLGADSYNLYWDTSPGVTKVTGTKITGVTSPYIHLDLTPLQPVYYVITAEDEDGESDISSEVYAIPLPPEGVAVPQEPVDQTTILSTFSENDYDNISKLNYPTIGTPPVSGHNKIAGDLYDLYEDIEQNSCKTDNSFDLEEVSSTSVKVTTGRCIIGGVCIDIKEDKILNIDDENSYFNWANVITGAGTLYVLIYYDYVYNPSISDRKAYIGLMKKTDYNALTTDEKEYYCFLGAIKVNSSVEIVSPLYYWDPDDTSQDRPHPKGFADGGWLDLPEEFIY